MAVAVKKKKENKKTQQTTKKLKKIPRKTTPNLNHKRNLYSASMKIELRDFIEMIDRIEKLDSTEARKGNRISLKGLGQGFPSR